MVNNVLKKYTFWNNIDNQLLENFDFSQTSIGELADKSNKSDYINEYDNSSLHNYIFKFYAYNELLSSYRTKNNGIIDNEDLKFYSDYQYFCNDFSKKIFSFILYSCLTECRHSKYIEISLGAKTNKFNAELIESYIDYQIKHLEDDINLSDMDVIDNLFDTDISIDSDADHSRYSIIRNLISYYKDNNQLENIEKINDNFDFLKSELVNLFQAYANVSYNIPNTFTINFKQNYKYVNDQNVIAYNGFLKLYPEFIHNPEKFDHFFKFIERIGNLKDKNSFYLHSGDVSRHLVIDNSIQNSPIKDFTTEEMFEHISTFFLDSFEVGYGGKAWSDIAKHALSFAKGEINAEIFIDQALSMEHNNGNMFSKDFIFDSYNTKKVLDIYFKNYLGELDITSFDINITDFILNIQNFGSVLSIGHLIEEPLYNAHSYINDKELQKEYKNYNEDNKIRFLKGFEKIFKIINSFSLNIETLKPMLEIAKKIDYSIPKFDWGSMSMILSEQKVKKYGYNEAHDSFKKYKNPNCIFSDIINSNNLKVNNNQIKSQPFFKLYDLNYNNSPQLTKEVIGGKAHGLISLIHKGFNVPKALVFDTKTCLSYLDHKEYFNESYKDIDKQISDYLTDDKNKPLLVSVRSGAPVSMPGMMDSILNIGIDDKTYVKLCNIYSKEVIDQCSISFMNQFCNSKFNLNIELSNNIEQALQEFSQIIISKGITINKTNLFPLSKESQIKLSVEAVFDSWNCPRAIAWRNEKNIDHNLGTAATVQQMVFGNKNDKSLTCVIFSRDCITGKPDIMGEYLPQAQGEDLVNGKRTPLPISELKISNPKVYQEIEFIAKTLEEEQKAIQDIEITVEDGKVYVLQMRNAIISPEAQLALAKDMGLNLLDVIQPKSLIGESKVDTNLDSDYKGLVGSPGLISGIIVRNQEDIDKYKSTGKDLIFFSNQALPEHANLMIATQGFVTEVGGTTSHAAILARSMGKPCIVGIGNQDKNNLQSGSIVTINACEGKIWKGELPIVVNQESAIELANQLIAENNISLKDYIPHKFVMQSWITDLSFVKNIPKKENKNIMFLNIAQQVALALQKNHQQEIRKGLALN